MSNEDGSTDKKSFWHTIPGFITAAAGIITALTGLFVALNSSKTSSATNGPNTEQVAHNPQQPQITLAVAEKLTTDFINAVKTKNVDEIMSLVSVPFFNDHNIETDLIEIRQKFQSNLQEKGNQSLPEIKSIKVKTVKEWKNEGRLDNHDRILNSLNIGDDDFYAAVEFPHDVLAVAFRKVDNKLKIAGIWD